MIVAITKPVAGPVPINVVTNEVIIDETNVAIRKFTKTDQSLSPAVLNHDSCLLSLFFIFKNYKNNKRLWTTVNGKQIFSS